MFEAGVLRDWWWGGEGFVRKVISSMNRQQSLTAWWEHYEELRPQYQRQMAKQGQARVRACMAEVGESGILFLQLSEDGGGLKTRSLQPGPLISSQETKKGVGWEEQMMEPISPLMLTSSSGKKSWHPMSFGDCEPRPEQRPDSGIELLLGVNL